MNFPTPFVAGLSLSLSVCLGAIGCTAEPAADTDTDTATDTGTDTDDPQGECVEFTPLGPVVQITVDGQTEVPTLDASCEISELSVAEGSMSLGLSCIDAAEAELVVEILAPAEQAPAGVEVGATVELELDADASAELGNGPQIMVRDANGPIVAQILWSLGGSTNWGPFTLSYASHCPATGEPPETGFGFVLAELDGGESHEVFVGEPAHVNDGAQAWVIHALDATDVCCHGPSISVALIRGA